MQFIFNGDIRRPVAIAIEATSQIEALAVLEAASRRGNMEDQRISVYDEISDQRLAAFEWDGEEDTIECCEEIPPRLCLVKKLGPLE